MMTTVKDDMTVLSQYRQKRKITQQDDKKPKKKKKVPICAHQDVATEEAYVCCKCGLVMDSTGTVRGKGGMHLA